MDILTAPIIDFAGVTLTRAEAVGFIAALAALGFAIRRDPLTFPAGMVAHLVSLVLMAGLGVYLQAAVQAVFILLAAQGWWLWSRHRGPDGRIAVARMGQVEVVAYIVVPIAAAAPLWFATGGLSAPMLAGGVAVQLALNFRRVENWLFRIAVDLLALALFIGYGAWIPVAFHLIFAALSVKGWLDWRRAMVTGASLKSGT